MNTYGLIGYPLGHSFSRGFFTDKFHSEGTDAEYRNFEIPQIEDLQQILADTPTLCGFNVTIPYKQQVMQYLDSLTDEARAIGAVNVVRVFRESDGDIRLRGYNSDVIGFSDSIRPLLQPYHSRALILGTGGASKAVFYAMKNIFGMDDVRYVSRTPREGQFAYSDLTPEIIQQYPVIINCTPCGMHPHTDQCPDLPYQSMTSRNLLFDLVYNPEETLFMKKGKAAGATVKNGHEMLILQAVASWRFWTE